MSLLHSPGKEPSPWYSGRPSLNYRPTHQLITQWYSTGLTERKCTWKSPKFQDLPLQLKTQKLTILTSTGQKPEHLSDNVIHCLLCQYAIHCLLYQYIIHCLLCHFFVRFFLKILVGRCNVLYSICNLICWLALSYPVLCTLFPSINYS